MSDLRMVLYQAETGREDYKNFANRFYDPTCATDVLVTAIPAPGPGRRILLSGVLATKDEGGGNNDLILAQGDTEFLRLGHESGKTEFLNIPIPLTENTALKYRNSSPTTSKYTFFYNNIPV